MSGSDGNDLMEDSSLQPTGEGPTPECRPMQDIAAAIAMDAATPEEEAAFERHAATCEWCVKERLAFGQVASLLGTRVTQVAPPDRLRVSLLDAAQRTAPAPQSQTPSRLVRLRQLRVAPVWGAVAASLIVATASLLWATNLNAQVSELSSDMQAYRDKADRYDRVVSVLASQQLAVKPLRPAGQNVNAWGMIYLDPASGRGMAMVHNMPPLRDGTAWELWFMRDSTRVPGGMMRTDATGSGYMLVNVPPDVTQYDSCGMTEEPVSGSPWPTTPRVVGAEL